MQVNCLYSSGEWREYPFYSMCIKCGIVIIDIVIIGSPELQFSSLESRCRCWLMIPAMLMLAEGFCSSCIRGNTLRECTPAAWQNTYSWKCGSSKAKGEGAKLWGRRDQLTADMFCKNMNRRWWAGTRDRLSIWARGVWLTFLIHDLPPDWASAEIHLCRVYCWASMSKMTRQMRYRGTIIR